MDVKAVFLDADILDAWLGGHQPNFTKTMELLHLLEIRVALIDKGRNFWSYYGLDKEQARRVYGFEFIISLEDINKIFESPRLYYEAQWRMDVKKKEALVITTHKETAYHASEAYCRVWLLESSSEFTVEKLDELLCSTKYGL